MPFVIATAALFGWSLAYLQMPATAVELLQAMAEDRYTVLLLIVAILLLLGTFMDLAPMILICTPIFLPVAKAFGVEPLGPAAVRYGAGAGRRHRPGHPAGRSVLFVGTAIGRTGGKASVRSGRSGWASIAVLLAVAVFPQLSGWLPALFRA